MNDNEPKTLERCDRPTSDQVARALAAVLIVDSPCPKEIFSEFEPSQDCNECPDNIECWIEWAHKNPEA